MSVYVSVAGNTTYIVTHINSDVRTCRCYASYLPDAIDPTPVIKPLGAFPKFSGIQPKDLFQVSNSALLDNLVYNAVTKALASISGIDEANERKVMRAIADTLSLRGTPNASGALNVLLNLVGLSIFARHNASGAPLVTKEWSLRLPVTSADPKTVTTSYVLYKTLLSQIAPLKPLTDPHSVTLSVSVPGKERVRVSMRIEVANTEVTPTITREVTSETETVEACFSHVSGKEAYAVVEVCQVSDTRGFLQSYGVGVCPLADYGTRRLILYRPTVLNATNWRTLSQKLISSSPKAVTTGDSLVLKMSSTADTTEDATLSIVDDFVNRARQKTLILKLHDLRLATTRKSYFRITCAGDVSFENGQKDYVSRVFCSEPVAATVVIRDWNAPHELFIDIYQANILVARGSFDPVENEPITVALRKTNLNSIIGNVLIQCRVLGVSVDVDPLVGSLSFTDDKDTVTAALKTLGPELLTRHFDVVMNSCMALCFGAPHSNETLGTIGHILNLLSSFKTPYTEYLFREYLNTDIEIFGNPFEAILKLIEYVTNLLNSKNKHTLNQHMECIVYIIECFSRIVKPENEPPFEFLPALAMVAQAFMLEFNSCKSSELYQVVDVLFLSLKSFAESEVLFGHILNILECIDPGSSKLYLARRLCSSWLVESFQDGITLSCIKWTSRMWTPSEIKEARGLLGIFWAIMESLDSPDQLKVCCGFFPLVVQCIICLRKHKFSGEDLDLEVFPMTERENNPFTTLVVECCFLMQRMMDSGLCVSTLDVFTETQLEKILLDTLELCEEVLCIALKSNLESMNAILLIVGSDLLNLVSGTLQHRFPLTCEVSERELKVWLRFFSLCCTYATSLTLELDSGLARLLKLSLKDSLVGLVSKNWSISRCENQRHLSAGNGDLLLSFLTVSFDQILTHTGMALVKNVASLEWKHTGNLDTFERNLIRGLDWVVSHIRIVQISPRDFFDTLKFNIVDDEAQQRCLEEVVEHAETFTTISKHVRDQDPFACIYDLIGFTGAIDRDLAWEYIYQTLSILSSPKSIGLAYLEIAKYLGWQETNVIAATKTPRFPEQSASERKASLMEIAVTCFEKGRNWFLAIDTLSVVLDRYALLGHYQKAALASRQLASLYQRLESDFVHESNYYYVCFQGEREFGYYHNKAYIYEMSSHQRLEDIKEAYIGLDCEVLSHAPPNMNGQGYILVHPVKPVKKVSNSTRMDISGARASYEALEFVYTRITSSADSVENQYAQQTVYTIRARLPTASGRSLVVSSEARALGPEAIAVSALESKTLEVLSAVSRYHADRRTGTVLLEYVLSGCLAANINGGVQRYCGLARSSKRVDAELQSLRRALVQGLEIYGSLEAPGKQAQWSYFIENYYSVFGHVVGSGC